MVVNNLKCGFFPLELCHVPGFPVKHFLFLLILQGKTNSSADDLFINHKIDTGLAGIISCSDQKVDMFSLDSKDRRGERACGFIMINVGVYQAFALVAGNFITR